MKLNLGCGKDYRAGWMNVDVDPKVKADLHVDVRDLAYYVSVEQCEYILLNHVFEHLTFKEGGRLLACLHNVLQPHGTLEIAVPDLPEAMREYLVDTPHSAVEAPAIQRVYGNQSTRYEIHKSGYSKTELTKLLTQHDFTVTEDLSTQTEVRLKCKLKTA